MPKWFFNDDASAALRFDGHAAGGQMVTSRGVKIRCCGKVVKPIGRRSFDLPKKGAEFYEILGIG